MFLTSRIVQLQRLAPRGHKHIQLRLLGTRVISHPLKKAKRAFLQGPSYAFVPGQSPLHLGQSVQKVKEQPFGRLVLCLSGLTRRLRFSKKKKATDVTTVALLLFFLCCVSRFTSDDAVDKAVFFGSFGSHKIITVCIALNHFKRLTSTFC